MRRLLPLLVLGFTLAAASEACAHPPRCRIYYGGYNSGYGSIAPTLRFFHPRFDHPYYHLPSTYQPWQHAPYGYGGYGYYGGVHIRAPFVGVHVPFRGYRRSSDWDDDYEDYLKDLRRNYKKHYKRYRD